MNFRYLKTFIASRLTAMNESRRVSARYISVARQRVCLVDSRAFRPMKPIFKSHATLARMSHLNSYEISRTPDHELIAGFQDLCIEERERLATQLEYIAELDRRKLFFHYSSLRSCLVEEYGMEEWNVERKIRAARLLKRFPEIKNGLQSGKLNLTLLELAMGCAHREKLSDTEITEIISAISGQSCRAATREIASRYPQTTELPKDRIRPLNADYSEVRFVASHELLEKLEEIRGLLAHSHPKGLPMGELIDILATEYRERHHPEEKAKRAKEREMRKSEKENVENQAECIIVPTVPTAPRPEGEASVSIQVQSEDQKTENRQSVGHASAHIQGRLSMFVCRRCHEETLLFSVQTRD